MCTQLQNNRTIWVTMPPLRVYGCYFSHSISSIRNSSAPSKRKKILHLNWIIFRQNNIFRFGASAYLPSSLPKNLFDILRFSNENGIRFRHKKLTDKEVKLKMSKKSPKMICLRRLNQIKLLMVFVWHCMRVLGNKCHRNFIHGLNGWLLLVFVPNKAKSCAPDLF